MQTTSPVPRNSPLTVTTTTRYESSSRNHVSSPRNYSLSPTSQIERASPVNYVPASTQRIASPINMQRVTSPITTITHRITTPLTSPLTVKVIVFFLDILWGRNIVNLRNFLRIFSRVEPVKRIKWPRSYPHTKLRRITHHPMTRDAVHHIQWPNAYLVLVTMHFGIHHTHTHTRITKLYIQIYIFPNK